MQIQVTKTPKTPENLAESLPNTETGRQRLVRLLPRITSLFQFLQVPEPEIESLINEMDKVGSSTFRSPPTLTRTAASRE